MYSHGIPHFVPYVDTLCIHNIMICIFTFIIIGGIHAFEKGKPTISFAVEAPIKYLLLRAFSSGVLHFSVASLCFSTVSTIISTLEGNYTHFLLSCVYHTQMVYDVAYISLYMFTLHV